MILPFNASLIISAARHLIKLGARIDNIAAEKAAVTSDLVLKLPEVATPDLVHCAEIFATELRKTKLLVPDPFGTDRLGLESDVALVLEQQKQPSDTFGDLFKKYFPDANFIYDPNAQLLAKLRATFPGVDWKDPGARIAAFAIGAGSNNAQIGYSARIALSVVDTLFEFGAENAATIVHDSRLRGIVETVLQRLAEPDWGSFTQWNPLLQTALKSVLNAALDVAEKNPASNPWLQGTLDALAQARKEVADKGGNGDDYLLGLLQGHGFRELLAQGLLVAADRLDDDQSNGFRLVAADVLGKAAPLVLDPNNADFRTFFNAHWGDLLRAGLSSVDRHGNLLLGGANPLLGSVLKTVLQQLATIPDARFFTSDTLFRLTDATIDVVADNLTMQPGLETKPWLRDFLVAAAATARQLTAKNLFTKEAAESLLRDAITALAQNPDLLIKQPGLPRDIATAVLGAVRNLSRPDARIVGETVLRAALGAIAQDPSLADKSFGPAVQAVATTLAEMVAKGQLNAADAAELAEAATGATLRNPKIFAVLQKDVASTVLRAVQGSLSSQPWCARLLVKLARAALVSVARVGGTAAANQTAAQLQQQLFNVLNGGLKLAADRLGNTIDLEDIPAVLAGLIERALKGGLASLDPQNADFQKAFDQIVAVLAPQLSPA